MENLSNYIVGWFGSRKEAEDYHNQRLVESLLKEVAYTQNGNDRTPET